MASRNILDLSLDDIIKMKRSRKSSRGGGPRKKSDTLILGRGQNKGGPRGRGISSPRSRGTFKTRGNIRNRGGGPNRRGTSVPRRGQGIIRGRAGQGRGRGSNFNERGGRWMRGGQQSRGVPRGATRGTFRRPFRGRGIRGGRGFGRFGTSRPDDIQQTKPPQRRELAISRERRQLDLKRNRFTSEPVPSTSQSTTVTGAGRRLAVHRRLAMKKVQQAKRLLVGRQQNSRAQARISVLSKRRGIKTQSSLDSPLNVRVGGGAVVKGLRSDRLLLQKMQQAKGRRSQQTVQRLAQLSQRRERIANIRERGTTGPPRRGNFGGSTVSLSSNHGLRVSIKNPSASTDTSLSSRARPRNRTRLNRNRLNPDNARNLPTTITLFNEHARPPSPPSPPPIHSHNMRRNIMHSRDAMPFSRVNGSVSKVRTEPQPHRQTLNSKIQKEIAMLQGKNEVTLNSGPGPGVKGFQLVPSKTTTTLSERFTHERMVTS